MQQLTFELAAPEPPTFANFVAGRNEEVVAVLRQLAAGGVAETGLLLWGARDSGRTHLLHATAAAAALRGLVVIHPVADAVEAEPPASVSRPIAVESLLVAAVAEPSALEAKPLAVVR